MQFCVKKYMAFYLSLFMLASTLSAQDSLYNYEGEIVVTASRIPLTFPELSRNITTISRMEIEQAAVNSIQELLGLISGVDVQQRGVNDVQADISIRGATFEQSLIMVDGIRVNDPQTGHHNMDITLSIADIERIEILKGQGSASFGSAAFGGAINIITKTSAERKMTLSAETGQYGSYSTSLNVNLPWLGNYSQFSVQKSASEGYRANRDYSILSSSLKTHFNAEPFSTTFHIGFKDKDFGAQGFYTPGSKYAPREETVTLFSYINLKYTNDWFFVHPTVSLRKHDDTFTLVHYNPSLYKNKHQGVNYIFDLKSAFYTRLGTTSLGAEISIDTIESNSLGNHRRKSNALYLEHRTTLGKHLHLALGGSAYNYGKWGWTFWPEVDLSYLINDQHKIYGAYGQAYRIPTYTELYYSDGRTTEGNPGLQPESSVNYEVGYAFQSSAYKAGLSFFKRETNNLIDWVLNPENDIFYANNFLYVQTQGIEASLKIHTLPSVLKQMRFDYTFLNSSLDKKGMRTRYAINHPRHHFAAGLNYVLIVPKLQQSWQVHYQNRPNVDDFFLINTKVQYEADPFKIFLKVTNLFNQQYHSFEEFMAPGRWIWIGLNYGINF